MYKYLKNIVLLFAIVGTLYGEKVPESDISLTIEPTDGTLMFRWSHQTSCALFEMMGRWFLIFGHASNVQNLPRDRYFPIGFKAIKSIQNTDPSTPATIYELDVVDTHRPIIEKNGTMWRLGAVKKNSADAKGATNQIKGFYENWPSISFSKVGLSENIYFQDPVTGAAFLVLLTYDQNYGFLGEFSTPFFEALQTGQGLAFLLTSKNVWSEKSDDILKIVADSPFDPIDIKSENVTPPDKLEFNIFNNGSLWDSKTQNREWEKAFDASEKCDHGVLNLIKAWFDVGLGDPVRAQTFLELTTKQAGGFAHAPFFRAVNAISHVLKGEYADAILIFSWLPQTPEIKLWDAIAKSLQSDPLAYVKSLRDAESIFSVYPEPLKSEITSKTLLLLLDAEELLSVGTLFEMVQKTKNSEFSSVFDYVSAALRASEKEKDKAFEMLQALTSDKKIVHLPPDIRARALRDIALISLEMNKISNLELIKKLESIRLMWRGDRYEFYLLYDLAKRESAEKQYLEALKNLSLLRQNFSDRFKAFHLDAIMEQLLVLFFKQDLSAMSPIRIVAVYEEYKEYSPTGADEEMIIGKVIDRLISLDLLDQAAELLNKSIIREKDTEKRNKLIFQVAKIHISNRQPKASIAVLNQISGDLSDEEKERISRMRALSWHFAKESEKAFDELKDSKVPQNRILLADLYVYEKEWSKAASILTEVISMLEKPEDRTLKEESILKLGISQFLDNNIQGNLNLGITFRDFMKTSKYIDIFNLVTKGQNLQPANREELMDILQSSSLIQKSLTYLDKLNEDAKTKG